MKYAELHCASAFSFLEGASQPEDLIDRAVELDLPAVALVDRNTLSGAPRFWKAAREAGIKPLVGAEVVLDDNSQFSILNSQLPSQAHPGTQCDGIHNSKFITQNSGAPAMSCDGSEIHNSKFIIQNSPPRGPLGLVPPPKPPGTPLPRLTLLAADRRGYRNLCRLLTEAARGRPKGQARATKPQIAVYAEGLHCLTGGAEGLLTQRLLHRGLDAGPLSSRRKNGRRA